MNFIHNYWLLVTIIEFLQIVELPTTGGWLCPVSAYKNWQKGRKGGILGGSPVVTWKEGSLITLEDMNIMLGVLLDKEVPKITTRAFRPALPSILAREGASEEMLISLRRWTSSTYLHYVREGKTGDWKGLLQKLRNLSM